jgi:hypothetical protein
MPDTTTPDPVAAYLAEVRERSAAAEPGPWHVEERHGRDYADEGWSQLTVHGGAHPSHEPGDFGVTKGTDDVLVAECYFDVSNQSEAATENAAFIAEAHTDVPHLLAALEAVLARHSKWEIRDGDYGEGLLLYPVCKECCARGGAGQTEECAADHNRAFCWPCATVRDISRELLGEGETGA